MKTSKFNDLFSKLNDDNVYQMQAIDLIKSLNPKPGLKISQKIRFLSNSSRCNCF